MAAILLQQIFISTSIYKLQNTNTPDLVYVFFFTEVRNCTPSQKIVPSTVQLTVRIVIIPNYTRSSSQNIRLIPLRRPLFFPAFFSSLSNFSWWRADRQERERTQEREKEGQRRRSPRDWTRREHPEGARAIPEARGVTASPSPSPGRPFRAPSRLGPARISWDPAKKPRGW